MSSEVARSADGTYHPASQAELICLVQRANREGRQLRVRGAGHSVSRAVFTDADAPYENRVGQRLAPPTDNYNVVLDRYGGWRIKDEARKLVEVDAGIHLGPDPGSATLEESLLWQLAECPKWTLDQVGGITHQTVSGFVATGSSGGSVRYSVNENLWGFAVIDGTGKVHHINREDHPDCFYAMAPSLGLLGVISTVTLKCVDLFAIAGQESTTTPEQCSVDLLGGGGGDRSSLQAFLQQSDYARLEWWPQRGAERVVRWQAQRVPVEPGFVPHPYRRFGRFARAKQHSVSLIYTLLGNLQDLKRAKGCLADDLALLKEELRDSARKRRLGVSGRTVGHLAAGVVRAIVFAFITGLRLVKGVLPGLVPAVFPFLLGRFVPLDRKPDEGPRLFTDWAWRGLPMDNEVNELLLPTAFTEVWLPLTRTQEAMDVLQAYFASAVSRREAYERTGTYAWELYAAQATRFWLSPSYSSGCDEWTQGAFRIDPYWFAENDGDAVASFMPLWTCLREAGLPFRLHWAKYQPPCAPYDRSWLEFLRDQYPRWDDFLRLRAQRDPNNIFLTQYWRDRFGLWDLPIPKPMS